MRRFFCYWSWSFLMEIATIAIMFPAALPRCRNGMHPLLHLPSTRSMMRITHNWTIQLLHRNGDLSIILNYLYQLLGTMSRSRTSLTRSRFNHRRFEKFLPHANTHKRFVILSFLLGRAVAHWVWWSYDNNRNSSFRRCRVEIVSYSFSLVWPFVFSAVLLVSILLYKR